MRLKLYMLEWVYSVKVNISFLVFKFNIFETHDIVKFLKNDEVKLFKNNLSRMLTDFC